MTKKVLSLGEAEVVADVHGIKSVLGKFGPHQFFSSCVQNLSDVINITKLLINKLTLEQDE